MNCVGRIAGWLSDSGCSSYFVALGYQAIRSSRHDGAPGRAARGGGFGAGQVADW